MTSQTNSRYAAFTFVAAMTAMLLVVGSLSAGNTPQGAMHDARIVVSALMATANMSTLPILHIENPL